MKDFDAERKIRETRQFRIGGKEFHFRPAVQQEILDDYFDSMGDEKATNAEILIRMDNLILSAIDPECADDWRAVRAADVEVPLMGKEIHGVIQYMLEVMLNRPIEVPSVSGDTPEANGTSSTDKSPSLVATSPA